MVVRCCCGDRFGRLLIQLAIMLLFVVIVSSLITVVRWPRPPPMLYEEETDEAMREWDRTL